MIGYLFGWLYFSGALVTVGLLMGSRDKALPMDRAAWLRIIALAALFPAWVVPFTSYNLARDVASYLQQRA